MQPVWQPQKHPGPYAGGRDRADAGRPGVETLLGVVPLDPPAVPALGVAARDTLDGQGARGACRVVGEADDGEPPAAGARTIEDEEPVAFVQAGLHGTAAYEGDPELAWCQMSSSSR